MDIDKAKKGMWVDSLHGGVGKILAVDNEMETVLVESLHDGHQRAVDINDIHTDDQLHNDCDKYY